MERKDIFEKLNNINVNDRIKTIQSYKTNRWCRRTFISQEEN